jgi:hypothetical protein
LIDAGVEQLLLLFSLATSNFPMLSGVLEKWAHTHKKNKIGLHVKTKRINRHHHAGTGTVARGLAGQIQNGRGGEI